MLARRQGGSTTCLGGHMAPPGETARERQCQTSASLQVRATLAPLLHPQRGPCLGGRQRLATLWQHLNRAASLAVFARPRRNSLALGTMQRPRPDPGAAWSAAHHLIHQWQHEQLRRSEHAAMGPAVERLAALRPSRPTGAGNRRAWQRCPSENSGCQRPAPFAAQPKPTARAVQRR